MPEEVTQPSELNPSERFVARLFELEGMIKTVTTIPTSAPTRFEQQFVIYVDDLASPTVKQLWYYSAPLRSWQKISELTADEKAALAGTSGTPSAANKFVTADDVVETYTASKIPRRTDGGQLKVPASPVEYYDAASKGYLDALAAKFHWATASNSLQGSDEADGVQDLTSHDLLVKRIQILVPGQVRIKFTLRISGGTGPAQANLWKTFSHEDTGLPGDFGLIFYSVGSFTETSWTEYTVDEYVAAGQIIGIEGLSIDGTLQVDTFRALFTINASSSGYGAIAIPYP